MECIVVSILYSFKTSWIGCLIFWILFPLLVYCQSVVQELLPEFRCSTAAGTVSSTTLIYFYIFFFFFFFFFFFLLKYVFLGLYLWHVEVPRLGVAWELQLLAYTSATATWDLSRVCDLHHSSQQCQILKPLSEARDWTRVFMDASQSSFCWATMGTPTLYF